MSKFKANLDRTGTYGQISWGRLEQMLRDATEIWPYEKDVTFTATDSFLIFQVKREDEDNE